jgi:hypothetical protein
MCSTGGPTSTYAEVATGSVRTVVVHAVAPVAAKIARVLTRAVEYFVSMALQEAMQVPIRKRIGGPRSTVEIAMDRVVLAQGERSCLPERMLSPSKTSTVNSDEPYVIAAAARRIARSRRGR